MGKVRGKRAKRRWSGTTETNNLTSLDSSCASTSRIPNQGLPYARLREGSLEVGLSRLSARWALVQVALDKSGGWVDDCRMLICAEGFQQGCLILYSTCSHHHHHQSKDTCVRTHCSCTCWCRSIRSLRIECEKSRKRCCDSW